MTPTLHAPSTSSDRPRRIGGLSAAVVATALLTTTVLTACSTGPFSHETSTTYDTVQDAEENATLATALPSEVSAGATDIEVRIRTDDPSRKTWRWTGAADLGDDCTANRASDVTAPFSTEDWPQDLADQAGSLCGVLEVVSVDGQSYAWLTS